MLIPMNRISWTRIFVVLLVLMLAMLACGGSSEDDTVTSRNAPAVEEEVAVPDTEEETESSEEARNESGSGDAELVVENLSDDSVCFLYVSSTESTDWGEDQLGDSMVVDPGESYVVYDIPVGTYDLRAEMCEGDYVEEGNVLLDGEHTWSIYYEGASGEFMVVTDDYGSIQVEVPVEWSEVNGEPWYIDGDVIGAQIMASPDLTGFLDTWEVPGMMFSVSDDLAQLAGYLQLLDFLQDDFITECEYEGREDYEDALYRGKYDLYNKCGGPGGPAYMVLSAVSKDDQFSYLILVETQMVTDQDWDVAQHVLDTFQVVDELP